MPMYMITYDLRKVRNYNPLYECFAGWNAVRLLKSVWLVDLVGLACPLQKQSATFCCHILTETTDLPSSSYCPDSSGLPLEHKPLELAG